MTEPTPIIRKPRYLQASLALFTGLLLLVFALVALRQPPAHASQPLGDQPTLTNQPFQAPPLFQQRAGSALSICSQHAPKCPLTAAGWPGEPDGWQYTGKKWIWVPGTPNVYDRQVVWEYSQPYSGSTPEYFGQREDHYASCSGDPADCSLVSGTHPVTYDWERWLQEGDNFRVMQLGNISEEEAYLLGETDCTSGIIYPVVDHLQPFASTPMYTDRWGACNGNGYVAASLYELWGELMSQKRVELCDNPANGVPASLSQAGNTLCKISPYAGVVYQRYIFGTDVPSEPASVGCEAVLYAWGWSEPLAPDSAQAYQAWFRNGELRFTRWHDLSDQVVPGEIPAADDDDWWNPRCQDAWTEQGNWLYTGTFRAGANEYSDQAQLPLLNTVKIPPSGGNWFLDELNTTFTFPSGTFTATVQLVQFTPQQEELPPSPELFRLGSAFYIFAEDPGTLDQVQPGAAYTVTVQYADSQVGSTESSLALYGWDGRQWLREPTSAVDLQANTVSATPQHFSLWAVMAEARRMYLPHLSR